MSDIYHKVVLIGDSAVGKTSITTQYIHGAAMSEYCPTVGIDFFVKDVLIDDTKVTFQIWDTAGQERFHSIIPSYIRNSTVAFLVFDITLRNSFESLQKWHQLVTNVADPGIIVVGNKVDLEEERQVLTAEGEKFAAQIGAEYIETSARSAINLNELFMKAAKTPLPEKEKQNDQENENPLVFTVNVGQESTRQQEQQSKCFC